MTRGVRAPAWDPGAQQIAPTGFAGSAGAVSVHDCTMAPQIPSSLKSAIVDALSDLLSINPALASTWAHVVEALWPGWKEL